MASDAELVEKQLRKAGIMYVLQRVDSRDGFAQALDQFHPDLVLADYSLPDFDGLSAVKMARQSDPDLPIIVVSGMLGDEAAAGVVKAGANDYVLKDRLARLGSAVERAIEEAAQSRARKRAEAEIRTLNSERELRVATRTAQLQAANRLKEELVIHER